MHEVPLRSPYGLAIDATRAALIFRSILYRRLVVLVVATITGTLAFAGITADWRGLLCFLLLPGWFLAFAAFDLQSIQHWREKIFDHWRIDALQIDLLAQTLRQVPNLPSRTLDGMLRALPQNEVAQAPLTVRPYLQNFQSLTTRIAVAWLVACSAAWISTTGLLVVAVFTSRPRAIAGSVVVVSIMFVLRGLLQRHLRLRRSALIRACATVGQDEASTVRQLKQLS